MATPTIKSTYSLDVETVSKLEAIARRWKVSKSEALRRAIRAAAAQTSDGGREGLQALDELQAALHIDDETATRWGKRVRAERRARAPRLSSPDDSVRREKAP